MRRRKKTVSPQAREDWLSRILSRALRHHRNKRREIRVLAAEAVTHPRAHARVARQLIACVHEGDGRIVIDRFSVEALDDAEVISNRLHVRQEIADPQTALATKSSSCDWRHYEKLRLTAGHARHALRAFDAWWKVFSCEVVERLLLIEQIDVRHAA